MMENCQFCRYWKTPNNVKRENAAYLRGECRRRSPTRPPKLFAQWPETYSQDGCGDFRRFDEAERPLEELSDREIANVLHGRAPDDNGEFTASSMGAAQDARKGR